MTQSLLNVTEAVAHVLEFFPGQLTGVEVDARHDGDRYVVVRWYDHGPYTFEWLHPRGHISRVVLDKLIRERREQRNKYAEVRQL